MNNLIAKASITINAPITKVWEALTKPEIIKQYMFGTNPAIQSFQSTFRQTRCSGKLPLRIIGKLDYFCVQEDPLDFAESLIRSDLGQYRFRIGDYRVTFDLEDEILVIHDVDDRKDIYR